MEASQQNILKRLYIYQKERFPILSHGLLILVFTFSAISFSRICRGVEGFVSYADFIIAFFTSFSLFLLLRILDEFKDKEDDAKYRSHLPVPRGLISLGELKILGLIVFSVQLLLIIIYQPTMLILYFGVLLWLGLMTFEFFMPKFLKPRLVLYASLHMLIIPFIDLYVSGIDWRLSEDIMHKGLLFFFFISFFNGMVLEIGRKIKSPESEAEGVQTYSKILGYKKSVWVWLLLLSVTLILCICAISYASLTPISYVILAIMFSASVFFAFRFLKSPSDSTSKHIEVISGLWTLAMYAVIGGLPGLLNFIF